MTAGGPGAFAAIIQRRRPGVRRSHALLSSLTLLRNDDFGSVRVVLCFAVANLPLPPDGRHYSQRSFSVTAWGRGWLNLRPVNND